MYVKFRRIRWKNFISSGTQWIEILLDKCQTSLIVGDNGAGKSTFLDAISFALYGKPFRKINKGLLVNTLNNKDCLVELEFTIGSSEYLIRRGIKPSVFEVFQDGLLLNQDADPREYQEILEKQIVKIPFASFPHVIVLGSAVFVPFMQLEKKDRNKMLEGLLGTEIFTTMATLLKDKVTTNKAGFVQVDAYIEAAERQIETEKRRQAERLLDADLVIEEKRVKVKELEAQIFGAELEASAARSEAIGLREQLRGFEAAKKLGSQLVMALSNLQARRDTVKGQRDFYHNSETCMTCKQNIPHDFKVTQIKEREAKLVELNKAVLEAEQKLKDTADRLLQFERTENWAGKFEASDRELIAKVTLWTSLKTDVERDIEKIQQYKAKQTSETGDLAQIERELASYHEDREKLVKVRTLNEVAGVLLKDTGIKTRIVRQYIPKINKLVNKYLASMDFFVNFELDENFEEKVKSRFRDEFTYNSFSEGEKSRLDLALLFTWLAIAKMRNSSSTNLLILDEVFDGSLDAQGNEEIVKILHTLTAGSNVFVITHKTDAFTDKFERVIKFEKHKNFSRIAETV